MPATPRPNLPNIGRNDPCPCGSGKKYKKCCLKSEPQVKLTNASADGRGHWAANAAAHDSGLRIHPYALAKVVADAVSDNRLELPEEKVAVLKDKWSIAKVARMETAEIVLRLEKLGIAADQAEFVRLAGGRDSAWSVGADWVEDLSAPPGKGDEDFICLAACELWKRYCPERPSIEMVDDWVTEGCDLSTARKEGEAAEVWLRAWDQVRCWIKPAMTTFGAVDAVFKISQFFGNWIQDFVMSLGNAALDDRKYAEIGIRVTREVLGQFVAEDLNTVLNFRCDLGRFLFLGGRRDEGEAVLQSVIREYPAHSHGYACLVAELGVNVGAEPDYPRAIAILEQALAYPVIDADDWDLESRLADLREQMGKLPPDGPTA